VDVNNIDILLPTLSNVFDFVIAIKKRPERPENGLVFSLVEAF
jgi:hypothetical protein